MYNVALQNISNDTTNTDNQLFRNNNYLKENHSDNSLKIQVLEKLISQVSEIEQAKLNKELKSELDEELLYLAQCAASQAKLDNALKKLNDTEVRGSNWEKLSSRLQGRSKILEKQHNITSTLIDLLKEQNQKLESDESWKSLEIKKFTLWIDRSNLEEQSLTQRLNWLKAQQTEIQSKLTEQGLKINTSEEKEKLNKKLQTFNNEFLKTKHELQTIIAEQFLLKAELNQLTNGLRVAAAKGGGGGGHHGAQHGHGGHHGRSNYRSGRANSLRPTIESAFFGVLTSLYTMDTKEISLGYLNTLSPDMIDYINLGIFNNNKNELMNNLNLFMPLQLEKFHLMQEKFNHYSGKTHGIINLRNVFNHKKPVAELSNLFFEYFCYFRELIIREAPSENTNAFQKKFNDLKDEFHTKINEQFTGLNSLIDQYENIVQSTNNKQLELNAEYENSTYGRENTERICSMINIFNKSFQLMFQEFDGKGISDIGSLNVSTNAIQNNMKSQLDNTLNSENKSNASLPKTIFNETTEFVNKFITSLY